MISNQQLLKYIFYTPSYDENPGFWTGPCPYNSPVGGNGAPTMGWGKGRGVIILLYIFCATVNMQAQQAGDLDPTFGNNGIVRSSALAPEGGPIITSLVLRGSLYNDIVVSGTQIKNKKTYPTEVFSSYKKIDGSPSTGFTNSPGVFFNTIASFIAPGINRLIMAGRLMTSYVSSGVDRLVMAGRLIVSADPPFTIKATATEASLRNNPLIFSGIFNSVVVDQTNQYIFAGGSTLPSKSLKFARFNVSDFGNVINTIHDFPPGITAQINSIALQSDGHIVAAATITDVLVPYFVLMRYSQNAILESTNHVFFPQESSANAVTTQFVNGSEKIVAAGWIKQNNKQKLALVRYNLDGTPDTDFGAQQTGKIIESFGGNLVTAHAIAIDKNNKIVVVGEFSETETTNPVFLVARYNTDGILDKTFGPDASGWVLTSPSSYGSVLNAVAIDEDNKIVCSGYSININGEYELLLVRYIGNQAGFGSPGTPDIDFGDKGLITTLFSTTPSSATPSSINPSASNSSSIAPFSSAQNTNNNNSVITGMVIRNAPFNDIVVVGNTETTPLSQIVASYKSSDGTLNIGNFGSPLSQGYINYRTASANNAYAIAVQNGTNNITTAGNNRLGLPAQIKTHAFFNFSPTGTFIAQTHNMGIGEFKAIAHPLGPTNTFLYAGSSIVDGMNFILAKFTYNGELDGGFGYPTLGQPTTTNFTSTSQDFSQINAIAVYPTNGKIVVAGTAVIDEQNRFVLARYSNTGVLDTTFGDLNETGNRTGKIVADFSEITLVPNRNDAAYGVALQQIGGEFKIVVVGATARKHGGYFIVLARYNDNGTLDPTFGYTGKGIRINCFGSSCDSAKAVVIDDNNRIIIAGIAATKLTSKTAPINKFIIARYTPDGKVDTTFNGNGRTFTRFFGKGAGANAVALHFIDGKPRIVASGFAIDDEGHSRFALARYFA